MNPLTLNAPEAISSLTAFITKTVQEAGFSKVVLGISGGVDSALSAFLSARALGPNNVLCLRLPHKTSSPESLLHAQLVIDQLGVPSKTIDISPAVDAVLKNHPDASPVRRGNIMARIRMIHIYDQSAAFPGLVVGTGNKTEILLGYSTIHGDGAFDFNPLGDLYKFQVRQMARELGVPEVIITKAPSADLWVGQTDEGDLGYSYQEMDRLLFLLVEEKLSPEACIQEGFADTFVSFIVDRVNRYRYKSLLPLKGSVGQFPVSRLEEIPAFSK
ncbi:MAG TPA: NAD+ synthase [Chloroflexi bacterium]|nr:MAG: NAD(+) synthetase [Chloroflexota bacterium]HDD55680.1 NAD+ synthase [Chloroflexota bacterium]